MKILICGKGGSGKSVIATMLAKALMRKGYKILVVDSDESNFGLHRQLGMRLPEDFTHKLGGKWGVAQKLMKAMVPRAKKVFKGEVKFDEVPVEIFENKFGISDIPKEYLSEKNGIKLLAVGKIHEFGEGCACPMGALTKELLKSLELNRDEIVIVDTDAGIEHFGRGVEQGCDLILLIVDPTYESVRLAEKVNTLSEEIGKPLNIILNKVSDNTTKETLLKSLDAEKVIAVLPENEEVFRACLEGNELNVQLPEIEELADKITRKLG
ncbi:MAG: AAA family ATPase [Candidatus Freyrarchaeum guaymaensis]